MLFSEKVWKHRRVLITGHTGFKGVWLTQILVSQGAEILGYSLPPDDRNKLFNSCEGPSNWTNIFGDIRDAQAVSEVVSKFKPEIVFHMAAQPLVLDGYRDPITTYETNVIGTLNVLQACRAVSNCKAIVNVTTDKCYDNKEWVWGYRETDKLGGFDPYSSSKACSEILTDSFRRSYFEGLNIGVATARAGNVIGGGDWAKNRIVPDAVHAFSNKTQLFVRNPKSTRPWQHVLEPLHGYMKLAECLFISPKKYSGAWNFGPNDNGFRTVNWLVEKMSSNWPSPVSWEITNASTDEYESQLLKLDISKSINVLDWAPIWSAETCVKKTTEWYIAVLDGADPFKLIQSQMLEFMNDTIKIMRVS